MHIDAHRCTLSHGMSWLLFKACSSAQHSRIELNLRFSVRDPWPMDSKLSRATTGFMRIEDSFEDFCMVLELVQFAKKGQ